MESETRPTSSAPVRLDYSTPARAREDVYPAQLSPDDLYRFIFAVAITCWVCLGILAVMVRLPLLGNFILLWILLLVGAVATVINLFSTVVGTIAVRRMRRPMHAVSLSMAWAWIVFVGAMIWRVL